MKVHVSGMDRFDRYGHFAKTMFMIFFEPRENWGDSYRKLPFPWKGCGGRAPFVQPISGRSGHWGAWAVFATSKPISLKRTV